jgi:hypothetical protein
MRRNVQIDRLVARHTSHGSATTPWFSLPHARYTLFVECDPPEAVQSLALHRRTSGPVPSLNAAGAERAGDVSAPLVQQQLNAGEYRVEIRTLSAACSWDVQVVLNSMLSWRPAPRAWRAPVPPPDVIVVRSGGDPGFLLSQTGRYEPEWTVGPSPPGYKFVPHSLDLRAADGHAVHLGAGTTTRGHRVGLVFVGAGRWTVEMTAPMEWEFRLTALVGPTGGGAHAF